MCGYGPHIKREYDAGSVQESNLSHTCDFRKSVCGFTLIEMLISLICASMIALGVMALLMPLRKQVVQQLSWSELAQQGRMATMVLTRLGSCARSIEYDQSQLLLGVDPKCARELGILGGMGREGIDESDEGTMPVKIFSRRPLAVEHDEHVREGLFIKLGSLPAQEWVSGVCLVDINFIEDELHNQHGVRCKLELLSAFGMKKNWEVYVPLSQYERQPT